MKKRITIWERYDKKRGWQHNHIENSCPKARAKPKPISRLQERAWKNAEWRRFEAYLVDGRVE